MNDTNRQQPRQISPASGDPVQLLQLTDCHIFATADEKLCELNTRQSFEKVTAAAINDSDPLDLVLATGDLSQDGSADSYRYLAQQIGQTGLNCCWLPGNHDDQATMLANFCGTGIHPEKQILIGNWQILMLDSTVSGEVHGLVKQSELDFLDLAMRSYPDRYTLVCLHHQAQEVGSEWLDQKGLKEGAQLRERLSQHSNLRAVLWGHVHQEAHQDIDGIQWMSTPSTCVQFKPGSRDFALGGETPGYRRLSLYSDGKIESSVYRVDISDLEINRSAGAY